MGRSFIHKAGIHEYTPFEGTWTAEVQYPGEAPRTMRVYVLYSTALGTKIRAAVGGYEIPPAYVALTEEAFD